MSDVKPHRLSFTDVFWTAFTARFPNASEALETLGRQALGMPPRPDVQERGRWQKGESGRARKATMNYTAFGGPGYTKNSKAVNYDKGETPCGYCGRAVKQPWAFAVRVDSASNKFVAADAVLPESRDQGCFPVGSDCAKRLTKAGVPVFEWKDPRT